MMPKTIADIIGEPNDPMIEKITRMLSRHASKMEQLYAQRNPPTSVEARRIEWHDAKEIVEAVRND